MNGPKGKYVLDVYKTHSTGEAIYREVKELILSNELPGGELISENEIAARMGTSRTPVREAFRRLEAEGWMRVYPKKGALIVPVAVGEAEHVIEARLLVESHAVETAVSHPAEHDRLVTLLRESLEDQREISASGDTFKFGVADADFHLAIVRAGRNPLLDSFYATLRDRQRRMTAGALARDPDLITKIVDDHAELVDFIAMGDAIGFRKSADKHICDVHGLIDAHRTV